MAVFLAWIIAQRSFTVPIPGTKRPERVDENAVAIGIHLSWDELQAIEQIAPQGARYPAENIPDWESPPLSPEASARIAWRVPPRPEGGR